ncbi:ribonuclease R family protein [Sphingomonas sp. GlSt437]|uniref:ribonuclease R family protein n=1 Tax=Sphingomonas sp. GlSt437 TaxID=3389970 RepID=UPI003A8674BE
MPKPKRPAGLPSRQQILDFITATPTPAGKREIARAFGLSAQEKIALKALLRDMADEGLIDSAPGRAFHKMGGVPKVTVLRVTDVADDGTVRAVPESWHAETPPPLIRVKERKRGALALGDRILARTEEAGAGWIAHPMKSLARGEALMLGVLRREGDRLVLQGVEKKERRDFPVADAGGAEPGDLVLAEKTGRPPRIAARVTQVLGDPFAPRAFSLIAVHKHGIPVAFSEEALAEAERVAKQSLTGQKREDLRHLPIVAIDPADARDHDDAVWAAPDDDPANVGGYRAIVAIADVSFYVRPGSELDREARRRGNSVYFPDRVVPMLPEILSADVCSLKEGADRAALACHLTIDKAGAITGFRFARALVRIAANIAYEDAQAAIDADDDSSLRGDDDRILPALRNLWACWRLLDAARTKRAPLDLDLPERRVVLDEKGRIMSVAPRARLDAHRLIEDYMIAANVAAALALEGKKAPVMYRDHEPPSREKLVALKEYLATFGIEFALGQVIRPATFNRVIERARALAEAADDGADIVPQIMEQVLRSQTQAYYGPENHGHFGLSLGSYAHFTSPIRRYADLIVHRSLVAAFGLGAGGLTEDEAAGMARIGESISGLERRAMEAERETIDRYVAAYLSERVGEVVETRITGVQNFGFFATVEGIGGDGLVPARDLGTEYFRYDEARRALIGDQSGETYAIGQRLPLRLVEANPVSGALRFELPEGSYGAGGATRGKKPPRVIKRRGRPGNIRHQTRRR